MATPATQARYTGATNGAAYGIEPNILQFGPLRPKAKTEIKGLFIHLQRTLDVVAFQLLFTQLHQR